jgi:UDP-N-acetylmuramate dehydrogenase
VTPREHEPLASHCTLGVGGPARFFIDAHDEAEVLAAWRWARARGIPLRILGGGSNLVVADEGVDGLVVRVGLRGLSSVAVGSVVELTAGAGEPWDAVVHHAVERGWAGLECLSGIPGRTGATPIQNVGAYGQEVSDTITAVRALHRERGDVVTLTAADCAFAYRDSMLKSGAPDRYVVLAVTYRLEPDGRPRVRYADLEQHLAARGVATPSLADVRASILAIRRSKSMVLDPDDPNRRSCGSFFLNPIVSPEEVGRIEARSGDAAMPRWRQADGRVKLAAGWLIERAGFARGTRAGPVGLSTRHTLAIVCHDGARAQDVLGFAARIRDRVEERFGVRLTPEPAFWPAGALTRSGGTA